MEFYRFGAGVLVVWCCGLLNADELGQVWTASYTQQNREPCAETILLLIL